MKRRKDLDLVSGKFNPIEALRLSGVIDFQVDGAQEKARIFCIVIFLYLPYFCYLCSLDGVVKP